MALLFLSPAIHAETDEELEKRIGPWLELRLGGNSVGPAQTVNNANPDGTTTPLYGSLSEGTLLPLSGEGFKRVNSPATSWGAGHMISLLQNASKEFVKNYDSQAVIHIGSIAQEHGGPFRPHSSHQNGLDADVLFVGTRNFDSVVDEHGIVTERFDRQKNWDFFKLLYSQKIKDGAKIQSVISMILVAPEIKTELCRWANENHLLEDKENLEMMKTIRPTAGHDDHFHIRLRCSPHHPQCRKQNISPRPC